MAIIFLLAGEDSMTALSNLQIAFVALPRNIRAPADCPRILVRGIDMAVIPISSSSGLVPCLDKLHAKATDISFSAQSGPSQRDLLSHCVNGRPLSERNTNLVMDLSSSFKELVADAFDEESQQALCDLVGEMDSARLLAFLKDGPSSTRL